MASFFKEGKTWTCDYYKPAKDGTMNRARKRGFILRKDAAEWYKALEATIQTGTYADAGKMTVGQWLNEWVSLYCSKKADNTIASYENAINKHIIPAIGALKLSALRPEVVQKFYNEFLEKPIIRTKPIASLKNPERVKKDRENASTPIELYSPTMLNRVHVVLNSAMRRAVVNGLLSRNPCDLSERPQPDEPKREYCTGEQLRDILRYSDDSDYYMPILLCVMFGLRRGEALGIKWDDVDNKNKVLYIRNQVTANNKDGGVEYKGLKSKRSVREYTMPGIVCNELRNHRISQVAKKLASGGVYQDEGFVCATPAGGVLSPSGFSHAAKTILAKAGIDKSIRLHDLRHSYATLLRQNGVEIETISELIGHSDVKTTYKFYIGSDTKTHQSVADKIVNIIGLE